ncbi:diaminopimelate epimerase [Pedobacter sp. SYP-B3415]|uniref:diaminopimelate epimerase n=1 Tax=Pedobacter sp. SYP-B3415 TaxID=2496641 RepID=UPI00101D9B30|nr:diaminopimelate epimerase [Pedobacter sp. SYP-B3415]
MQIESQPLNFYKYQGAGNDFILVDNRNAAFNSDDYEAVSRLCDRRFGIGGDGLMLLQNHTDYDFEMLYYNADGKPGSMCGNGGRCIVAFAKHLRLIDLETNFLAVDGPHYAKISSEGDWVELQMVDVNLLNRDGEAWVLNTGSPHYVLPVTGLEAYDVFSEGRAIRNNDTYRTDGINVNFVEDLGDHLFVRTFERGVEAETFACGTGVTAVALADAAAKNKQGHIITPIRVLGGNLRIEFDYNGESFTNIFLCGPAKLVFQGSI